jgi:hypothetical protein
MLIRTLYLIIVLTSFLAGCITLPQNPGTQNGSITETVEPDQRAKSLLRAGRYQDAAFEYQLLAKRTNPPARQNYQLNAVKALLKAKLAPAAKLELNTIDFTQSFGLEIPRELVEASIALAEQQLDTVSQRLDRLTALQMPEILRIEYHDLRAQLFDAQGRKVEAIRERVQLDTMLKLDSPVTLKDNHQAIWDGLTALNPQTLTELSQPPGEVLSGWAALVLLTKTAPAERMAESINGWQMRFPSHPANSDIVQNLLQENRQVASKPVKIALLLPLTGKFKPQAEAVRDGFLTAWGENRLNQPEIDLKDVTAENVRRIYQEAVDQGANFVVGPVQKEAVTALIGQQTQLPVPTLILNYLDIPTVVGNLYQFGLSPEQEASEVAARAWADGQRSAMVFVPKVDWGDRVLKAFQTTWEKQGGQLMKTVVYTETDIAKTVKKAISDGKMANMVFMGAFPKHGRQISPSLRSFYPGKLPIYSTSHVYQGTAAPTEDFDLNGVIFNDMPWVLAPSERSRPLLNLIQQSWPQQFNTHKRLYAFGIDAYQLLPHLRQMVLQRTQLEGHTGLLSIDDKGVVYRQLQWAQFVNGVPRLLGSGALPQE